MKAIIPLILFVALGIAFAFKLQQNVADTSEPRSALSLQGDAPALEGVALTDKDVIPTPEMLKGKRYLINFYASWCVPCQAENPLLLQLSQKHKIPIIGVAWKDIKVNTMKYLIKNGNPYQHVIIDAQSINAINYGLKAVPETYMIDEQGKLMQHISGAITETTMQEIIAKAAP